mmetsp:Transcript_20764/g.28800  ORF Transcript_20764/g.28800 Transcript_20764/m.28800 type:complete len:166 (+) Transcript_20764:36-533(+)
MYDCNLSLEEILASPAFLVKDGKCFCGKLVGLHNRSNNFTVPTTISQFLDNSNSFSSSLSNNNFNSSVMVSSSPSSSINLATYGTSPSYDNNHHHDGSIISSLNHNNEALNNGNLILIQNHYNLLPNAIFQAPLELDFVGPFRPFDILLINITDLDLHIRVFPKK